MKYSNRNDVLSGIFLFVLLTNQATPQTPRLILTGAPGERLGVSVAAAGDVNGDGIADLIVGADHFYGDRIGEALIYFGGDTYDFVADVVLTVGEPNRTFGWSVAGAGDVNGDGYDDVLVGDIGVGSPGESGRVYLYFGGAPMDSIPDVIMTGPTPGTWLGFSVASAGDLNKDGYDDIVVCGSAHKGAFVYFGYPIPSAIPDRVFTGGMSARCAGDINNDGYDDIIVADAIGPPALSYAYLYFGGASMDTNPDMILGGRADAFGRSVAGEIDINADGGPDLVIGAPADTTGGVLAGRAYVYFGGGILDTIPDFTITGSGANSSLGTVVSSLGDLDNDGYGDFSVTSDVAVIPLAGTKGKVQLFRGGSTISEYKVFEGEGDRDNFGWSVTSADFDNDNSLEVFIGASYAPYAQKLGEVYRYDVISSIGDVSLVPDGFVLQQNYPNPFNPSTTISVELPERSHVTLKVYDLLGREVATLIDDLLDPGVKSVEFASPSLSSGVYFYRVRADAFVATRKMILMR